MPGTNLSMFLLTLRGRSTCRAEISESNNSFDYLSGDDLVNACFGSGTGRRCTEVAGTEFRGRNRVVSRGSRGQTDGAYFLGDLVPILQGVYALFEENP